jgi:hypothetical protein
MVSAWWLLLAGAIGVSAGMFLFALMSIATQPSQEAGEVSSGEHLLT